MGYELIINPLPSTAGTIGGIWANKISQLFSGIDTSVSDPTNQPTIATPTKFLYQALRIRDSPNAKSVIFQGPGALDVDKTIFIPTMPVGTNSDTLTLVNAIQSPTNKTFDLSVNLLTETGKATGALLKHDGLEYSGLPRGTVNQVLTSTGTDLAWATISSANLPANVAYEDQVNIFTIRQESSVVGEAIRLANGGAIQALDSGAASRNVIGVTVANAINIGASAGWTQLGFFVGGERFRIISDGTVTVSPTWATSLVLNNGVALQGKDALGTARNLIRYISDDVYLSNLHATGDMYFQVGGNSIESISETGLVTWVKQAQAGVGEILMKWTVSDASATSKFEVMNLRTEAAEFATWLRGSYDGAVTSSDALIIDAVIDPALDTGSAQIMRFICRTTIPTAIVNRALFDFRNNATSVFKINANGDIVLNNAIAIQFKDTGGTARNLVQYSATNSFQLGTSLAGILDFRIYVGNPTAALTFDNTNLATFSKTAQAGVAEILAVWKVSDDATSLFEILNTSNVDGVFAPRLVGINNSSTDIFEYIMQPSAAMDTGTNPVIVFNARRSDNTVIQTRPLFDFRNRTVSLFKIDAKGEITQNILAQAGVAETLHTWFGPNDTDANSFLQIVNSATADAQFAPRLVSSTSAAGSNALQVYAMILPANDSGSSGIINIDSRRNDGAQVTTRPLFQIRNANTVVFQANAKGDILNTTIAGVGNFESCEKWLVSDDVNSYIELTNGTSVDAKFYPLLQVVSSANSIATDPVMYFRFFTTVANDTGTSTIVIFDARRSGSANVTTRPLFEFRNNGNVVLQINPWGVDFKDFTVKNMYGVATQPTFEKTGHWIPSSNTLSNGYGLFAGVINSGTGSVSTGANGSLSTFSVSTGAQLQGIKSDAPLFRGDGQPILSVKASASVNTDSRIAVGFSNQPTIQNAANPLANAHTGILMGWGDIDANIQIFFSEGTTATKFDTGVPKNISINHWGIRHNGTTWQYCLNVGGLNPVWIDVTGVTTPTTTPMYFHVIGSCVATSFAWQLRAADIKAV